MFDEVLDLYMCVTGRTSIKFRHFGCKPSLSLFFFGVSHQIKSIVLINANASRTSCIWTDANEGELRVKEPVSQCVMFTFISLRRERF